MFDRKKRISDSDFTAKNTEKKKRPFFDMTLKENNTKIEAIQISLLRTIHATQGNDNSVYIFF